MTNWKFSWGPFYNIYEPAKEVPIYDPPHGDYYSKPSQPKYVSLGQEDLVNADAIIARDRAKIERWRGTTATVQSEIDRVRRESQLKRQEYAEPFAVAYYFWLGIDAERRLW
jgi:hypothetical protein